MPASKCDPFPGLSACPNCGPLSYCAHQLLLGFQAGNQLTQKRNIWLALWRNAHTVRGQQIGDYKLSFPHFLIEVSLQALFVDIPPAMCQVTHTARVIIS